MKFLLKCKDPKTSDEFRIVVSTLNQADAEARLKKRGFEVISSWEITPPTYYLTKGTAVVMCFFGTIGFFLAPFIAMISSAEAGSRGIENTTSVAPYWIGSIIMLGFGLLAGLLIDIAHHLWHLQHRDGDRE
ncbi:MAG: hypothetical protein JKX85_10460 [Phycisphaeraceae bacterium]|nr:hypothetical protein [Phycisphaeraceae bacterium]